MPAAMMALTVAAASFDAAERQQQRAHRGRVLREPHGDARGDAQGALAAHEHPAQVEPGRLGVEAPEHGERAVGQHHLGRHDVGVGDAVGQAMGAAGVVGHVAADRARLLARRVGGEVEAERPQLLGEVEVDDAGLHPRDPVLDVDLQDAVHLGEGDHDGQAQGDGPAGQAGAGAAGHDGTAVGDGDAGHGLDLGGGHREAHRAGRPTAEHGGVVAQQGALGAVVADPVGGRARRAARPPTRRRARPAGGGVGAAAVDGSRRHGRASRPAALIPARAAASSWSEVSPEIPTAPTTAPAPSTTRTPPATGTERADGGDGAGDEVRAFESHRLQGARAHADRDGAVGLAVGDVEAAVAAPSWRSKALT